MIPLASTTITTSRPDPTEDPADSSAEPTVVATGVRAHFSVPRGRTTIAPGEQSVVDMVMGCDPCDLKHTDLVTDDTTGVVYTVVWVVERSGLGLDHLEVGVNVVSFAGSTPNDMIALGGVVA